MSTAYNKRRGGSARKPRPVRLCKAVMGEGSTHWYCEAAVRPDHNGNRCPDHRGKP